MRRGEIWRAEFEISNRIKILPVLVVQDNNYNESNIKSVLVAPMTSNLFLLEAPGNVLIRKRESRLLDDSVIIVSQLSSIDRDRLKIKVSKIDKLIMKQVEVGMKLVLGIN